MSLGLAPQECARTAVLDTSRRIDAHFKSSSPEKLAYLRAAATLAKPDSEAHLYRRLDRAAVESAITLRNPANT